MYVQYARIPLVIKKHGEGYPHKPELDFSYKSLDMRIGDKIIGHLDFEQITDLGMLEQMLINAIVSMEGHADRRIRNVRQAETHAKRIENGFNHAKNLLGENYENTRFPIWYERFVGSYNKFKQIEFKKMD